MQKNESQLLADLVKMAARLGFREYA